jgi:hypothetical protein
MGGKILGSLIQEGRKMDGKGAFSIMQRIDRFFDILSISISNIKEFYLPYLPASQIRK